MTDPTTPDQQSSGAQATASLDRRSVLALVGAAGIGALAGCSATDSGPGDDTGWTQGQDLPEDLDELHIQSGTEHRIPAGTSQQCQSILWDPEGRLTIEPTGSLEIGVIDG